MQYLETQCVITISQSVYIEFMKRFLVGLLLLLAVVSCTKSADTFVLKGEIADAESGEEVMLIYPLQRDGVWCRRTLTTTVADGEFVFEGELHDLSFAYLVFEDMDEIQIFIEPRVMKIELDRDRPYDFTLHGVSVEAEFDAFRRWLGDIPKILYESNRNLQQSNLLWLEAEQRDDPSADSLMQTFYDRVSDFRSAKEQELASVRAFLMEHLDYAIAPYILYDLVFGGGVEGDEALALYDQLPKKSRESALGQLAKQRIELSTSDVGGYEGDRAFDFERNDADGKRLWMSDHLSQGGPLLLDFWASWCAPCIEQMPKVRQLYDKYSERGLRIIGISVDDDPAAWRKGIEQHGLARYPQVLSEEPSDEELFFDELANIADRYEVESIPCYVLVGSDGKIIARWQSLDEQVFDAIEELIE